MKKHPCTTLSRAALTFPLCAALVLRLLWPAPATAGNYIVSGTVTGVVYGNGAPTYLDKPSVSTATGNGLTVQNGSNVSGNLFGGYAYLNGTPATAQGNHVTVENNTVITGNITGGYANASSADDALASGNSVTINGGALTGNAFIYGGTAYSGSGIALATGNTVTINDGNVTPIFMISGGNTTGGDATDNTVLISGGTFGDVEIFGGLANTAGDNATGNTILISGGTFGDAFITGGFIRDGNATGNSVTLSGTPYLTTTSILGGDFNGSNFGDIFSDNTLNVKTSGLTVASIGNFEHLNFYLPTTLAADGAMLTVTDSAYLTENTDGTGRSSQVHVGIGGGSSPLQLGDRVTLIDASGATGDRLVTNNGLNTTTAGEGMAGVTLQYEFNVVADTTAGLVTATVTKAAANEQAKALVEGFMGGLSLAAQGGDTVAGEGMANAVSAAAGAAGGAAGGAATVASFGAASGGSLRFNTGSHVDMHSVSLVAGLAWGKDVTPGRMTLGGFFEYGTGSYDTYNSFSNAASVHGKGDTQYWGGGILGRMDFTSTGPGHFYTEGSLRMGRLHNEYTNDDLRDSVGRKASYDSDFLYYSLHLGTGYVWSITESASLDVYGKYFWTRQEGDSVTLSTGDPVSFKDADSHRVRGGARLSYAINDSVSPYVGAAYEHEFDGRAKATTNGFAIDAPSLRGDTGIGEIGVAFKPSAQLPVSFNLGVQGYVGKSEGVTGSLQIQFEF